MIIMVSKIIALELSEILQQTFFYMEGGSYSEFSILDNKLSISCYNIGCSKMRTVNKVIEEFNHKYNIDLSVHLINNGSIIEIYY